MTVIELIHNNLKQIEQKIDELYKRVIDCDGIVQFKLYIWSNGEMVVHERPRGDSSYLVKADYAELDLISLCTVGIGLFDWRDYWFDSLPDDEQREKIHQEVLEWYYEDSHQEYVQVMLNQIIEDAKMYEYSSEFDWW